jgi:hypothetical protein
MRVTLDTSMVVMRISAQLLTLKDLMPTPFVDLEQDHESANQCRTDASEAAEQCAPAWLGRACEDQLRRDTA